MRAFSTAAYVAALLGLAQARPQDSDAFDAAPSNTVTSTAAITTQICYTVLRPNPEKALICGVEGTVEKGGLIEKHVAVNVDDDYFSICRDACMRLDICQSFSFDQTSTLCELFEKPIAEMGFRRKKNGMMNYGRACFERVCSTTTTTVEPTASATGSPGMSSAGPIVPEIFVLQVSGTGTIDDGAYLRIAKDWADEGYMAQFAHGFPGATHFTLQEDGTLMTAGSQRIGNINPGPPDTYFFFNAIERIALHGYAKVICAVSSDGLNRLTCKSASNTILEDCSGDLFITTSRNVRCTDLILTVIEAKQDGNTKPFEPSNGEDVKGDNTDARDDPSR